jgi:hypothetical protein
LNFCTRAAAKTLLALVQFRDFELGLLLIDQQLPEPQHD